MLKMLKITVLFIKLIKYIELAININKWYGVDNIKLWW
jgi:hypothetical protein